MSLTQRVKAPAVLVLPSAREPGGPGIRPELGRKPTQLLHAAGERKEPPISLPSAMHTMPLIRLATPPPPLPLVVFSRFHGLRVRPKIVLLVIPPDAQSGVLLLPNIMAPAAFSRATTKSSCVGICLAKCSLPRVVRRPRVAKTSFTAIGRPCNGPTAFPC